MTVLLGERTPVRCHVPARPARFRLAKGPGEWEVNAGSCHGIAAPAHGVPVRLAVPSGSQTARLLDVVAVRATSSVVEPIGWHLDPERTHPVVAQMEHIAQWTRLQLRDNPVSGLAGAVRVDVVPVHDGAAVVPRTRPAPRPDGNGDIRLSYRRVQGEWVPLRVFVRLHDTSDRRLRCVLIDLTERHGAMSDAGGPAGDWATAIVPLVTDCPVV
jgi:hypothetical protein